VKRRTGIGGLHGSRYEQAAKSVLATEILAAIVVIQTPRQGASPFFLLSARPQTSNARSNFQEVLIRVCERKGLQFLGPAADGHDAPILRPLTEIFLKRNLNFIPQQGPYETFPSLVEN
jgi:hypothetical protein